MSIVLKGITWDHPRGYDPLTATSSAYASSHPGISITWEKRSLQAFADYPVEQLAAEYDFSIIDHPHVGLIARSGCMIAFDSFTSRRKDLELLAAQSIGGSHQSYQYHGHQWALAIDAATQVACYRPDLLAQPPKTWNQVIDLARQGRVLWPIKPVDSLMSFFTLAANRQTPCRTDGQAESPLLPRLHALAVLELLQSLAHHVPRQCLDANPIEIYEMMSDQNNDRYCYCPLGYGYTNYSRQGFRPHQLKFTDIVEHNPQSGPCGSVIGGTGIALSSRCRHLDIAADYAFWIASAECQRTLYFDADGQPANAVAWNDDHCNATTLDFFRGTRRTMDTVYLRPRYDGYLDFQDAGGTLINSFLRNERTIDQTVDALDAAYRKSLRL